MSSNDPMTSLIFPITSVNVPVVSLNVMVASKIVSMMLSKG
jgi:hypothetical protein